MWRSKLSWENAKQRANVLALIRAFFAKRGVIEVETPQLSHGTITDVHLEAFSTKSFPPEANKEMYLQTSPEFAMKRLLASGYGSIYQIGKAFRYEASGKFHNSEFSLLEWYRVGFDHFQLMQEVDALLQSTLNTEPSDFYTYQNIFEQSLAIDPLDSSIPELKACIKRLGIQGDWIKSEQDKDILLQVLFSEYIEKKIGGERPVFVYNFPRSQASLAKISIDDNRVAERFECYYQGIELANGFNELTDSNEQKKRFKMDNVKRKELNKPERAIDNNFIEALASGVPDCAGVALGIDRLMMLALKQDTIEHVITFSSDNA